jgi:hypothetical protein
MHHVMGNSAMIIAAKDHLIGTLRLHQQQLIEAASVYLERDTPRPEHREALASALRRAKR